MQFRGGAVNLFRRTFLHLTAGAAALPAASRLAWAQTYPSRPITMVVGYGVGGPSDTIARIIAERMKPALGQPIVVENITGAAGSIGMGRLARAVATRSALATGRRCASMLRCTICHTMW
jgi:tripartite-type tricarboxylate transporter receptor subunit TctC